LGGSLNLRYSSSAGSILLIVAFSHKFASLKKEDFINCRLSLVLILQALYNINILLTLGLVCVSTFKNEGVWLANRTWDQILTPLYFFMTELLLMGIISFVVLVNSMIQLCFSSNKTRASRHFN
jgi:hypothetical protein